MTTTTSAEERAATTAEITTRMRRQTPNGNDSSWTMLRACTSLFCLVHRFAHFVRTFGLASSTTAFPGNHNQQQKVCTIIPDKYPFFPYPGTRCCRHLSDEPGWCVLSTNQLCLLPRLPSLQPFLRQWNSVRICIVKGAVCVT